MTKQQRNTRTEAAIRSAFITLMKQKGLAAMTVSDIARLANINRGTFYTHYTDKFDLCQQLIDDAQNDLTAIMRSSSNNNHRNDHGHTEVISYDMILACLQYIKHDYAFFDAISHSGVGAYQPISAIRRRHSSGICQGDAGVLRDVSDLAVAEAWMRGATGNHRSPDRYRQASGTDRYVAISSLAVNS